MDGERYRVSIERLANAFEVEIPDMEARAKKMADAKKTTAKNSGMVSEPYMGDCTKKFAAKSVKEVLALIRGALEKIPENEYDEAFKEAASKMK